MAMEESLLFHSLFAHFGKAYLVEEYLFINITSVVKHIFKNFIFCSFVRDSYLSVLTFGFHNTELRTSLLKQANGSKYLVNTPVKIHFISARHEDIEFTPHHKHNSDNCLQWLYLSKDHVLDKMYLT